MSVDLSNPLGNYLRNRRASLDPAAFGLTAGRRRTPGLRREEVAQRANISPTWYTWLEQGRGGAPSADVLDRIARGLMLTEAEREHLFILGLGRLPEIRYRPIEGVEPRLQRILDALEPSPALIKNALWDVLAWNRGATALFTDYAALPRERRNILRLLFGTKHLMHEDWGSVARFVVGAFRADVVRAGASAGPEVRALIEELTQTSQEFARLWRDNEIVSPGDGNKRLRHPKVGLISLDVSNFSVDGRPELGMIVYSPVTQEDSARIQSLMENPAK